MQEGQPPYQRMRHAGRRHRVGSGQDITMDSDGVKYRLISTVRGEVGKMALERRHDERLRKQNGHWRH